MKTDINNTSHDSQAPKQEKSKHKDNLALGISLGMLGGCTIGAICDDIGTWMSIGVMLGVALSLLSSNNGPQNKNRKIKPKKKISPPRQI